jgi:hypothetical protein
MPKEPPLPMPLPGGDMDRPLAALVERRMLAPARRAGYELRLVGATVLPQGQTIERTRWGTWLFVDHMDDPTAKQYGGRIPIPALQIARLNELYRADVNPQFVRFGHQLPDDYREGDPLVPVPRELREKDERLRLWFASLADLVMGAAASFATSGVGLDPVIFGGVKHPKLPLVGWCALAQWEWE